MLINVENTSQADLLKLKRFAEENEIKLSFIDDNGTDYWLPGKPLSELQIEALIESSRKSGMISMKDAHNTIRKNSNAD